MCCVLKIHKRLFEGVGVLTGCSGNAAVFHNNSVNVPGSVLNFLFLIYSFPSFCLAGCGILPSFHSF